jgi:hypothetical protein
MQQRDYPPGNSEVHESQAELEVQHGETAEEHWSAHSVTA